VIFLSAVVYNFHLCFETCRHYPAINCGASRVAHGYRICDLLFWRIYMKNISERLMLDMHWLLAYYGLVELHGCDEHIYSRDGGE